MKILILAILFISKGVWAAEPTWQECKNIPASALTVLEDKTFTSKYIVTRRINPFYLQGDFNGDHNLDLAILIKNKKSGEDGIAILHAGSDELLILGAGTALGNGGSDFSWMDAWHVYTKVQVQKGADENPAPKLLGDGLYVEKLESASAIVFWNGNKYEWYQQGD